MEHTDPTDANTHPDRSSVEGDEDHPRTPQRAGVFTRAYNAGKELWDDAKAVASSIQASADGTEYKPSRAGLTSAIGAAVVGGALVGLPACDGGPGVEPKPPQDTTETDTTGNEDKADSTVIRLQLGSLERRLQYELPEDSIFGIYDADFTADVEGFWTYRGTTGPLGKTTFKVPNSFSEREITFRGGGDHYRFGGSPSDSNAFEEYETFGTSLEPISNRDTFNINIEEVEHRGGGKFSMRPGIKDSLGRWAGGVESYVTVTEKVGPKTSITVAGKKTREGEIADIRFRDWGATNEWHVRIEAVDSLAEKYNITGPIDTTASKDSLVNLGTSTWKPTYDRKF
jgi:hypothetical protein